MPAARRPTCLRHGLGALGLGGALVIGASIGVAPPPARGAEVTVEQLQREAARQLRPRLNTRAVLPDKEINAGQRRAIKRMQPRLKIKAVISSVETRRALRKAASKQRRELRAKAGGSRRR